MHSVVVNVSLAFIEGFALILSPCILPILPIILSGSLDGRKSRPIGIILGFAITFTIITLFSRVLIEFTHISQDALRIFSFIILLLLGIMMVSTYLTEKFNILTSRLVNVGSNFSAANNPQSGFFGGLLFGGLVGIIWTPCAGPILAAVIVQVVIQETTLSSILTVSAFALGAGLPMLLIALVGRTIMDKFGFIRNNTALIRKLLGLVIIASVIYLIYDSSTSYSAPETKLTMNDATTLKNGLEAPYPAPQIAGIDAWINSSPLQLSDLKGKVVLIDFWTYSCINCIRTLPYIKDWYAKYHDQGLVIIGIHSPEFQFEHDLTNVKNAVLKDEIKYPVALDNNFVTWRNFHNEYWPAHYLIDKNGNVVYEHFGEGEYDVTENNIKYLLGLKGAITTSLTDQATSYNQTPETYFGYARAANFASPEGATKDKVNAYSYPKRLSKNQWALQGKWVIYPDKIVAASAGAAIKLHFDASKVYVVMGMKGKTVPVKVMLNGKLLKEKQGADVSGGKIIVNHNRLYAVIDLKKEGDGVIELIATTPGLEMYTFTFGG